MCFSIPLLAKQIRRARETKKYLPVYPGQEIIDINATNNH